MSQLAALANPNAAQIDASVLDYFLIEAVNTLKESTAVSSRRQKRLEEEMIKSNVLQPNTTTQTPAQEKDRQEDLLKARLENLGIHAGASLVERYAYIAVVRASL